jgi:hypothetical protein
VQLLAEWTETFPYDFRDERVMGHVRSITQKVANVDAAARQEVSVLLQNLLLKLTALERYEEALARLATEASTEQLTQVRIFFPNFGGRVLSATGGEISAGTGSSASRPYLAFSLWPLVPLSLATSPYSAVARLYIPGV